MTDIHLREPAVSQGPRTKPPPKAVAIPVPFTYTPSDDGTDENLLILLHGLGVYFVHSRERELTESDRRYTYTLWQARTFAEAPADRDSRPSCAPAVSALNTAL